MLPLLVLQQPSLLNYLTREVIPTNLVVAVLKAEGSAPKTAASNHLLPVYMAFRQQGHWKKCEGAQMSTRQGKPKRDLGHRSQEGPGSRQGPGNYSETKKLPRAFHTCK